MHEENRMRQGKRYRLDNSAMIHLAGKRKKHTNTFCIEIVLTEAVSPNILQKALEHIVKRFPTIFSEIHSGVFQYYVCQVQKIPYICEKTARETPMSKEEIRNGAFRVRYHEHCIVTEFFHSLTDGHGGLVVASTLVAEYLRLRYGVDIPVSGLVFDKDEPAIREELADDYITYAGTKGRLPNHKVSFQLSDYSRTEGCIQSDIQNYNAEEVLQTAHHYHVSVTTFLASVVLQTILQIQNDHPDKKKRRELVQIMVPVDLRRIYDSRTLRNFSLFAICSIVPQEQPIPFQQIIEEVDRQLKTQTTKQYMREALAAQVNAAHFPLYRALILPIKCGLLRLAQELWGERNSCITVSNLGRVTFPENMEKYVQSLSMNLTPRRSSPYNCGIVSYKGVMTVRFSRCCEETELEEIFAHNMKTNIMETFHTQFSDKTRI